MKQCIQTAFPKLKLGGLARVAVPCRLFTLPLAKRMELLNLALDAIGYGIGTSINPLSLASGRTQIHMHSSGWVARIALQ